MPFLRWAWGFWIFAAAASIGSSSAIGLYQSPNSQFGSAKVTNHYHQDLAQLS